MLPLITFLLAQGMGLAGIDRTIERRRSCFSARCPIVGEANMSVQHRRSVLY